MARLAVNRIDGAHALHPSCGRCAQSASLSLSPSLLKPMTTPVARLRASPDRLARLCSVGLFLRFHRRASRRMRTQSQMAGTLTPLKLSPHRASTRCAVPWNLPPPCPAIPWPYTDPAATRLPPCGQELGSCFASACEVGPERYAQHLTPIASRRTKLSGKEDGMVKAAGGEDGHHPSRIQPGSRLRIFRSLKSD